MKLLLRRDQRQGLLGKVVFQLEVRADLSDAERADIQKYKLGETVLYANGEITDGSGLLGVASRLAYKAMMISVNVKDLVSGKKIECKDIVEMLAVEDQIREPTHRLFRVLGDGSDAIWTPIGAAWPNRDGLGFNLSCDAIPLQGRLVMRLITERGAEGGGQQ